MLALWAGAPQDAGGPDGGALPSPVRQQPAPVRLGPDASWRVVEGDADDNYYRLREEQGRTVFHASYPPAQEDTVTLGKEIPETPVARHALRWSWRVHQFPEGAPEQEEPHSDSACAVYATFGSTFHRQSIKYVWSATVPKGTVIGPRRTWLYDVVTVVLEGPGVPNVWRTEEVDVARDWARWFGDGKGPKDAPPMRALGLLTDGDDSHSQPSADYADILLLGSASPPSPDGG